MEKLPKVNNLRDAIREVIKNNQKQGYPPNHFMKMVSVYDNELVNVCSQLINSQESLSALFDAFLRFPNLLTIEDYVSYYGEHWGFTENIIDEARRRSKTFDDIVNKKRYGI